MKQYEIEMRIVTPVIINTGKFYDFCEIFPNRKNDKNNFYLINVPKAINSLPPNISANNIEKATNAMYQVDSEMRNSKLRDARNNLCSSFLDKEKRREIVIRPLKATEDIEDSIIKNPMLQISKIADTPNNGLAYIPGSSIKGAIRTGLLEKLRAQNNITLKDIDTYDRKKVDKNFEARIYSGIDKYNITSDPFKYLKISDFVFEDYKTDTYLTGINTCGESFIYTAMTSSEIFCGKSICAKGTISIDSRFGLHNDIHRLLSDVSTFYSDIITQPNYLEYFNGLKGRDFYNEFDEIRKSDNYYFLRLGHYCGIQNFTFNIINSFPQGKNKNPRINIEGGKNLPLIDNKVPAGFCLLKVL